MTDGQCAKWERVTSSNRVHFLPKIGSRIHSRTLRNSDTTEHVILVAASAVRRLRRTPRDAAESLGPRTGLLLHAARLIVEQGCQFATAARLDQLTATEQQLELRGAVQASSPGECAIPL